MSTKRNARRTFLATCRQAMGMTAEELARAIHPTSTEVLDVLQGRRAIAKWMRARLAGVLRERGLSMMADRLDPPARPARPGSRRRRLPRHPLPAGRDGARTPKR